MRDPKIAGVPCVAASKLTRSRFGHQHRRARLARGNCRAESSQTAADNKDVYALGWGSHRYEIKPFMASGLARPVAS